MAQKQINYGSSPNDGTGDTLRDFAIKSQQNFTDLYNNSSIPAEAGVIEVYQKGYLNGIKNLDPFNLERGDLGKVLLNDGNSVIGVWRTGTDGQDWAGYEQLDGFNYEPVTD